MADEADKLVQITMVGGVPTPNIDPIPVKKDKQKIKWCAAFDFRITIEGYSDINYSSGGTGCPFEAKSGKFPTVKSYKYTITAGGVDNDPSIDVQA